MLSYQSEHKGILNGSFFFFLSICICVKGCVGAVSISACSVYSA